MNKLIDKKHVNSMTLLCVLTYLVSYITRINFGAIIVEIISQGIVSKTAASLVTTAGFITYGVGQLISGYLGDKINPRFLIFSGLAAAALMNILMPFTNSTALMITIWAINGFAQSMMWPPLVKIMTNLFNPTAYSRACVRVSWGSSFGTIAVYLIAPICIVSLGWQAVFYISSVMGIVMSFVWLIYSKRHEAYARTFGKPEIVEHKVKAVSSKTPINKKLMLTLAFIMLAIVLQGILRDGVTTWMPSYISETYKVGSFAAIFSGVVLPIFSILAFQAASIINRRYLKNELLCAGVIFGVGFIASALLSAVFSYNAVLSVALSAIITGSMHGVNLVLICMVPTHFAKHGNVSFISGLLNFCTYIGSAVSMFGIALMSEKLGWQNTILGWSFIALIGTLVCITTVKRWKSYQD